MSTTIYSCPVCGKNTEADPSPPAPECCGRKMVPEPLPVCSVPVSAETSRSAGEDGPCADGTTPKKN